MLCLRSSASRLSAIFFLSVSLSTFFVPYAARQTQREEDTNQLKTLKEHELKNVLVVILSVALFFYYFFFLASKKSVKRTNDSLSVSEFLWIK